MEWISYPRKERDDTGRTSLADLWPGDGPEVGEPQRLEAGPRKERPQREGLDQRQHGGGEVCDGQPHELPGPQEAGNDLVEGMGLGLVVGGHP